MEINVLRNRTREFESKIILKYQQNIDDIEECILLEVKQWLNHPLEAYYPFILMVDIQYKIHEAYQVVTKIVYVIIEIKEVISLLGSSESVKYWLVMLNEMKIRVIQNVSLFCVDGLTGFKEAITAVYRKVRIQRFRNWDQIINQLRIGDSSEE